MKRKIFSILFALVLVLSFSLVAAVPAGADPGATISSDDVEGPYVVGVEQKFSVRTTSDTTYDPVLFKFVVGGAVLGDVGSFEYYDAISKGWTSPETNPSGGTDTWLDIMLVFTEVAPNLEGYFGPSGGFPMDAGYDVTTEFRINFNTPKTYPVTVSLETVPLPGTVITSTLFSIAVAGCVNNTTGATYGTIQAAIGAALPGDTVNVAAGTYLKKIVINKALTVKSTDGAEDTIIQGISTSDYYLIDIQHSDVTFEGFTLTNPTTAFGSDVSGILVQSKGDLVSNVHILNNIVTQIRSETGTPSMYGATGINIGKGPLSDIVISGNTITDIKNPDGASVDHTCGINVWDGAENVEISNNTISDIKYNGILLQRASNVQIEDNPMITGCNIGVLVEPFEEGAVSGLAILDNTITNFTKGGIVVMDASSVQIEGNIISTTDHSVAPNGIQIGYLADPTATTGTVKDNQVSGCQWEGYDPGGSYEYTSEGEENWTASGILVIAPNSALEISGNEVQSCDVGLDIEASSGTLITNNDVHNNSYGFVLWNAAPAINSNNIYQNALCGVYRTLVGSPEGTLDALYNYWGDETGPSHATLNPGAQGDVVSDKVDFSPWLYETQEKFVSDAPCYAGSVVLGNEATPVEPGSYAGGWNSFSTPVTLDSSADYIIELLTLTAGSDLSIVRAQRFDLASQEWVLLVMGETVVDYPIKPGEGFFIQVSIKGSLPILCNTNPILPPRTDLVAGWNLVGLSNFKGMTVADALNSVDYSVVLSASPPNAASWSVPPATTSTFMQLGEAYWLGMGQPGILFGHTTTPVAYDMTWELNQTWRLN